MTAALDVLRPAEPAASPEYYQTDDLSAEYAAYVGLLAETRPELVDGRTAAMLNLVFRRHISGVINHPGGVFDGTNELPDIELPAPDELHLGLDRPGLPLYLLAHAQHLPAVDGRLDHLVVTAAYRAEQQTKTDIYVLPLQPTEPSESLQLVRKALRANDPAVVYDQLWSAFLARADDVTPELQPLLVATLNLRNHALADADLTLRLPTALPRPA